MKEFKRNRSATWDLFPDTETDFHLEAAMRLSREQVSIS